jgi:hypothetical protein
MKEKAFMKPKEIMLAESIHCEKQCTAIYVIACPAPKHQTPS